MCNKSMVNLVKKVIHNFTGFVETIGLCALLALATNVLFHKKANFIAKSEGHSCL